MTRKTHPKLRKILTLVSCAVLLVCVSVAGTLAYLTSTTEVVNNTFTTGDVEITLDEAKVNEYGVVVPNTDRVTENTYKLVPNHNYTKDPIVHVQKGSEVSFLFVKVVNGISAIEAAGDTTIHAQILANGWKVFDANNNIYVYEETVDAREAQVDKVVFSNFTIANDVEDFSGYEEASITIQAYAVQADGFDTAAAAWAAAPAQW